MWVSCFVLSSFIQYDTKFSFSIFLCLICTSNFLPTSAVCAAFVLPKGMRVTVLMNACFVELWFTGTREEPRVWFSLSGRVQQSLIRFNLPTYQKLGCKLNVDCIKWSSVLKSMNCIYTHLYYVHSLMPHILRAPKFNKAIEKQLRLYKRHWQENQMH